MSRVPGAIARASVITNRNAALRQIERVLRIAALPRHAVAREQRLESSAARGIRIDSRIVRFTVEPALRPACREPASMPRRNGTAGASTRGSRSTRAARVRHRVDCLRRGGCVRPALTPVHAPPSMPARR